MEDRRAKRRYQIWFPMRVENETQPERLVLSQNISPTGLLVASTTEIAPGATVKVRFRLGRLSEERTAVGHVVRSEPNDGDDSAAWPHRVAIELEAPADLAESVLDSIADLQHRRREGL